MINTDITLLSERLGSYLAQKGWTISTAESCTGGGVAYALTSVAGSSAWFERSFVTYSNEAKSQMLTVDEQILSAFGAVSQQVVEQMAQGCARQAKANVAISVSGIAGPDGGSADKPVGTVWFGFFIDGSLTSVRKRFCGDRAAVRSQSIEYALAHSIELIQSAEAKRSS